MENESKTKEVAKKKWDEIKRYKAMDLDEMLQEIVVTDSDIMHDDEELDL